MFNRLRAIWPKGYRRGSLGKSHKKGDYFKQAMVAFNRSNSILGQNARKRLNIETLALQTSKHRN